MEVMMNKLIFAILLAVLLPFAASAQTKEWRGQWYVFVAPSTTSEGGALLHIGGGGEGLVYKGLGVGGEIGYIGLARGLGGGGGILSPNVSYNFRSASKSGKFVPFVTGGYSAVIGSGGVGTAINFGGGMNWWFKDRVGLRLEVRDHIPPQAPSFHIVGVRIGLSLR
jgi:hypothetical protein